MHTGPYMCGRTGLTCILAALNNYSDYDIFTVNPLPLPTKVSDFMRLFADLTGGEVALVCIPGKVFHALVLGGVKLPERIFAIRGSHIFNYVYENYYWWRVDSKYEIREKIHVGEVGLAGGAVDDLLYLPYVKSDLSKLRDEIRSWKVPRTNDYYKDLQATLLRGLGGSCASPAAALQDLGVRAHNVALMPDEAGFGK
jgi:hypothetical protein